MCVSVKGDAIRRILQSRLPERFAHRAPPLVVELAVGIVVGVAFALMRVPLFPLLGERAPYAFIFLAVVIASVLAGWRAGLLALVIGQGTIVFTILAPGGDFSDVDLQRAAGLIFATIAQLLILLIIAAYQEEVTAALGEQEREMGLLSDALHEIDHRTKNNYQTVLALILLQAQRSKTPEARHALQEAADRVRAISLASDQLARRSEDLGSVRLSDHLLMLCEQIRRGLAGDDVDLRSDFVNIVVPADTAIHLSIVINELVTNALKHAFPAGHERKVIEIRCTTEGDRLTVTVTDNGVGMKGSRTTGSGLGTKLIDRFVRLLSGQHEVRSSDHGTVHRITVPVPFAANSAT